MAQKAKKILVTGGAGFIGSHTCVELLNKDYDVVVVDDLRNADRKSLKRVNELTRKPITLHTFDVCDEESLRALDWTNIACVIHFAGLKAVGESVNIPVAYYANNLGSTLALLKVMEEKRCTRMIFSSSATVYAQGSPMPVSETAPLGCTNPYGWTKLMCERILQDAAAANPELSVVLLRYFNPIGAHPSGRIGEDPSGIPNNLLPYITQTALGRRKKLIVHGNDYDTPDGTGVRDYIHVVDLAKGHVNALEYALKHTGCEAINLGTGVGYSVLDIVNAFQEVNGIEVPYVIGPRRPGDVGTVYSNPEKARQLLNWQTELGLEDMCRDAWKWQKDNPLGYRNGEE